MRLRKPVALLLDFLKMKFDGFLDELQNFFAGFARGDTARKVRNIGPEAGGAFLDDH
jgi:hypothetical protein